MRHIFLAIFILFSGSAHAVNPVALWMPASLQDLMPQLTQAAEMAEATERCDKVMSGRHSSRRSTPERPVFSIVCRDAQTKRTYSILYAVENGQIVEFNEQPTVSGADGKPVQRPWENPALKPVENAGTAPQAANVVGSAASSAANNVATMTAPLTPSAPPVEQAPPPEPTTQIDPRLAKLMARLEAAGVKGASAKAMMEDVQKKTLESNLKDYESSEKQARLSNPPKPLVSSSSATTPQSTTAAKQTSAEGSAATQVDSPATAAVPVSPPTSANAQSPEKQETVVQSVASGIAAQLWSQCLPAIKAKTSSMIDRVLDEKTVPAGYSGDAGATKMDVPFEAKNPEGMNLRFTAVCTVDAGGAATVKLRPRRE